jgi:hypothetical protein
VGEGAPDLQLSLCLSHPESLHILKTLVISLVRLIFSLEVSTTRDDDAASIALRDLGHMPFTQEARAATGLIQQ